jgi:hypothetical protein
VLLPSRLPIGLRLLVLVATVVHDPAHRGPGVGRHFHQVETSFAGRRLRFFDRYDADLLPFVVDQPDR